MRKLWLILILFFIHIFIFPEEGFYSNAFFSSVFVFDFDFDYENLEKSYIVFYLDKDTKTMYKLKDFTKDSENMCIHFKDANRKIKGMISVEQPMILIEFFDSDGYSIKSEVYMEISKETFISYFK